MTLQELIRSLWTCSVEELDEKREEIAALIPKVRIMFDFDQQTITQPHDLWMHALHTVANLSGAGAAKAAAQENAETDASGETIADLAADALEEVISDLAADVSGEAVPDELSETSEETITDTAADASEKAIPDELPGDDVSDLSKAADAAPAADPGSAPAEELPSAEVKRFADDMMILAALLHDIGKPESQVPGKGRHKETVVYTGHPEKGAQIVEQEILPALEQAGETLSDEAKKALLYYVRYHNDEPGRVKKYVKKHMRITTCEQLMNLLRLQIADCKAQAKYLETKQRVAVCEHILRKMNDDITTFFTPAKWMI